jgi:hypothetical protein
MVSQREAQQVTGIVPRRPRYDVGALINGLRMKVTKRDHGHGIRPPSLSTWPCSALVSRGQPLSVCAVIVCRLVRR